MRVTPTRWASSATLFGPMMLISWAKYVLDDAAVAERMSDAPVPRTVQAPVHPETV
jgi:hypothetical protein